MRVAGMVLTALVCASVAVAQDADRSVKDGGIKIEGWKGRIDRRSQTQGRSIADSKLITQAGALRLSVGPAGNFWNPTHQASGNYEVKATFKEHAMKASHPHSYGVFIGGADLESDTETLLYCIVYGTGTYSVKTFHGAKVTTLVDRASHAAINKANAAGEATNEIGWRVHNGKSSCVINGTEVSSFDKAQVTGPELIKSTDGNYGIRVSHNLELTVSGLAMVKH